MSTDGARIASLLMPEREPATTTCPSRSSSGTPRRGGWPSRRVGDAAAQCGARLALTDRGGCRVARRRRAGAPGARALRAWTVDLTTGARDPAARLPRDAAPGGRRGLGRRRGRGPDAPFAPDPRVVVGVRWSSCLRRLPLARPEAATWPPLRASREFVVARQAALLRTASLLTGHAQDAEDLVQTTLVKVVPQWRRIRDNPEPYVRRVLVNENVSRWRRRRWREQTHRRAARAAPDEPDHAELIAVRDALGRPRAAPAGRARAALLRGPVRGGDRRDARHRARHREVAGPRRAGQAEAALPAEEGAGSLTR